jgi:hypothetical protein
VARRGDHRPQGRGVGARWWTKAQTALLEDSPATWPARIMVLFYTLLGLGMLAQPDRYSRTPAYANLLEVVGIQLWGILYLLVAALLLAYVFLNVSRGMAFAIHVVAFLLTVWWFGAFAIRWLTNDSTTNVTTSVWLGFLFIIARSARRIKPIVGRLPQKRVTE